MHRFVAVASQCEEVLEERDPSVTYFCPTLGLPFGGYGRNTLTHVRSHEHFIKFRKHPLKLYCGYIYTRPCDSHAF